MVETTLEMGLPEGYPASASHVSRDTVASTRLRSRSSGVSPGDISGEWEAM